MTQVFVYGTLKRGGSNHRFLSGQRYLGDTRTAPGYRLYSLGDYPGMVRSGDPTHTVTGEIWSVDDACLDQLDALEGVDEGLYARELIALTAPFDTKPVATYLYLRGLSDRPPLGDTWPVATI